MFLGEIRCGDLENIRGTGTQGDPEHSVHEIDCPFFTRSANPEKGLPPVCHVGGHTAAPPVYLETLLTPQPPIHPGGQRVSVLPVLKIIVTFRPNPVLSALIVSACLCFNL